MWYHVAACQSRLHPMAKSAWASVSLWNFSQSSKFANQMYTLSVQSNVFSFNPEDILEVRWKLCPFSFVVLNEFVVGLICHWLVRLSQYFVISTNFLCGNFSFNDVKRLYVSCCRCSLDNCWWSWFSCSSWVSYTCCWLSASSSAKFGCWISGWCGIWNCCW